MAEFRMPSLGADMTEGVLLEWLVHPGDEVHKGDIVAVVDTSKAAVEIECFDTGMVERLLVDEGTRVPVGTPLATIQSTAAGPAPAGKRRPSGRERHPTPPARPPERTAPAGPAPVASPIVRHLAAQYHLDTATLHGTGVGGRVVRADVERAAHASTPAPVAPAGVVGGRVRISPLARRLATDLGVDVHTLTGTGPDGVINVDDVRRAAPPPATAAPAGTASRTPSPTAAQTPTVDRTAAMRATIAAAMTRAKREIPHYYLTHAIDLGAAMDWLHARNLAQPVTARLVPAALLLKAAARAAAAVPELNGFFIDGGHVPSAAVHAGVAISLRGGGLVAPAIHDADTLDLDALMAAMRDLVLRTRAGRLRGSELADATITVSSLGDQGVESIVGVIYPPQVALVGFGTVLDRPWAVNGLLGVRPVVVASLSGDHRVTDGAVGARFLRTVDQLLQEPEKL